MASKRSAPPSHEPRDTRSNTTRDQEPIRENEYQEYLLQSSPLYAPEPPPGVVYRWVRTLTDGREDAQNVATRHNQGWVPVPAEEVVSKATRWPQIEHEGSQVVGNRGQILMKIDAGLADRKKRMVRMAIDRQLQTVRSGIVDVPDVKRNNAFTPLTQRTAQQQVGGDRSRAVEQSDYGLGENP